MTDAEDRVALTPEILVEDHGDANPPFTTAAEWEAHLRWRSLVHMKPTPTDLVREALGTPIDKLEALVFRGEAVTAADRALAQSFRVLNELAQRAQSVDLVLRRYRKQDVVVHRLADIQALPLATIDRALPSLSSTYELVASVGGGLNGALGAPGAVMGVPTLLVTALHAVSSFGAHFGHDLSERDEQEFAVMLLTAALVTRPSQRRPVIEQLEALAYHLEADAATDRVEAHGLAIVGNVAESVVLRLVVGVLVRSWPGIGLILGAGYSRAFLSHVCSLALASYAQRWLFRKYGAAARVAMAH